MIKKSKEKRRDPTMEEGSCTDEHQKLQLIFKNLEHEWDFIKKRPEKTLYRTSLGSTKITKALALLDENSPRTLMYSLQQKMISPTPTSMDGEEVAWKVRTNDLAVEEILRERRAAYESGKLKGRRLFDEVEDVEVRSVFSYESDDNNYEDEINWPMKEHLSPSYPRCSYSSSCSSPCGDENLQNGSGIQVATIVGNEIGCDDDVGSGRERLIFFKVWGVVVISLIVFIVGIIATWSFGVYEDEEVILTPT